MKIEVVCPIDPYIVEFDIFLLYSLLLSSVFPGNNGAASVGFIWLNKFGFTSLLEEENKESIIFGSLNNPSGEAPKSDFFSLGYF